MMPAIAFYGSIPAEFGCTITRTPGVVADSLTLVIREEDAPRVLPIATVVLHDDNGRTYTLPNCRAIAIDPMEPGKVRLTVLERRWRWKGGMVDMLANSTKGTFIEASKIATVDQIIRRLMHALEESRVNYAGVTGSAAFPEVAAEGQKPADILLEVCERMGVEIIVDNQDYLRFVPMQFSPTLPDNPRVLERSEGFRFETGPDYFVYRGAPTLFQKDYVLEPIGLEPNGKVRAINDLSYKPPGGWELEDPRDFGGVIPKFRSLARRCVYRWFRIKLPVLMPFPELSKDTPEKVKSDIRKILEVKRNERWRILPMGETQSAKLGDAPEIKATSSLEGLDDEDVDLPEAIVIGRYWMHGSVPKHNCNLSDVDGNTRDKPNIKIDVPKTFDRKNGIVKFSEPIYSHSENFDKLNDLNSEKPDHRIRLRVGLGLRDRENKAFLRHEWYFKTRQQPIGTLPEYVQDDSIQYVIWDQYEPTRERRTNQQQFMEAAINAVRDKIRDVRPQRPETWQYDGIQLIEPGGRVRQVRYEYGENGGLITTVILDEPALVDSPTLVEQQLYRGIGSWIASQRRSRQQRVAKEPPGKG